MIINQDSLLALKEIDTDTIDAVITDPPYDYSFMGKDWDKAVPSVEIWKECLRVLKPGGWCMVMSAPRSDVQNAMISRLMEAGFRLDFTPIYWTYASGFPKAGNVGKLVDKRLGLLESQKGFNTAGRNLDYEPQNKSFRADYGYVHEHRSDQAKALDGSYTGFQPKPAVEVIIVAMKPLSEKTYVDQALKNGKGITWLDDCRVPTGDTYSYPNGPGGKHANPMDWEKDASRTEPQTNNPAGRFPANLLVSDDVLNDGNHRPASARPNSNGKTYKNGMGEITYGEYGDVPINLPYTDSGSYSRYFDLDKWASTLPFLIVPKASKSEKNKGLEHLDDNDTHNTYGDYKGTPEHSPNLGSKTKNHHPTVKPLKLMSYLITLTTRPGDTVLDPFVGSGTTVVAAKQLGRKGIGIEREAEYAEIARARVEAHV